MNNTILKIIIFLYLVGLTTIAISKIEPKTNTCHKSSTQAIQIKGQLVDIHLCEDPIKIIKVY